MPVTVIYPPEGTERFQRDHGLAIQQWLNEDLGHIVRDGQTIEFDQADVL